MPQLTFLDHLVLTVADMEQTLQFYTGVLGMVAETFRATDGTRRHALKFGSQKINLHQAGHEFEPRARLPQPGSGDLCFLTDGLLADWVAHLRNMGVSVEMGPIARSGAVGPITSIYLRDPDGNLIEIAKPDLAAQVG